jgi:hypothetical protein
MRINHKKMPHDKILPHDYENLYYDAKKEPKHIFATGLPKLGYYKKTNYPHY